MIMIDTHRLYFVHSHVNQDVAEMKTKAVKTKAV